MDILTLETKVKELATAKGIYEQEIYNRLLAFLETSYNYVVPTVQENSMIIEVKHKILTTLYSKDQQKQSVNSQIKYDQLFDLDRVEMQYLEKAFLDLESDGQVACLKYQISLTDKGIMIARNL